jgi:DNA adenine methylase
MTRYHGGKQRIGEIIADVIYDKSLDIEYDYNFTIEGYCEPFCGMMGVYKRSHKLFDQNLNYCAGDYNKSIVKMWAAAQNGWIPPIREFCKKEFLMLGSNGKSSAVKGYVGHLYGYMGKYFQPFESTFSKKRKENSSKKVHVLGEQFENVNFSHGSYTQYSNLKNYVIYCDPPYKIQNCYYDERSIKLKFDHDAFWDWCRKMSVNNIVFVSEYKAPKDFKKLWTQDKENLFLICK